jgi:hypothetical protein
MMAAVIGSLALPSILETKSESCTPQSRTKLMSATVTGSSTRCFLPGPENRRFWPSSALRAHTKTPWKTDLHRETLRALNRPRRAQTVTVSLFSAGPSLALAQGPCWLHAHAISVPRSTLPPKSRRAPMARPPRLLFTPLEAAGKWYIAIP